MKQPLRVLIVDDEPVNRALLEALLDSPEYEVATACDGAEALAFLKSHPVDLMLLDAIMPNVDGFEVCRRIRDDKLPVAVVMVTALTDRAARLRAIESGADEILTKPVDDLELMARIANVGRAREIAELRRRADEEAAKRKASDAAAAALRATYEALSFGVVVVDGNGRIEQANEVAAALLSTRHAKMLSAAVTEVFRLRYEDGRPVDIDELIRTTKLWEAGYTWVVVTLDRPDDRPRWLRLDLARFGEGVLISFIDTSAQRDLHEQLVRADRLASMGTVAAGIAHEINNPLAVIQFNLDELARLARHNPEMASVIAEAGEATRRVTAIVHDLRAYSHTSERPDQPVDVFAVIESALRLSNLEIRHKATVKKRLEPVPQVLGNAGRLSQVLVNLLVNAAQAMPADRVDDNRITVSAGFQDGAVVIEVRDNGVGIPEHQLDRIFETFYTTKPTGQGTGLGLSISLSLVQGMGGTLTVESQVGVGSAFRIRLPRVANSVTPGWNDRTPTPRRLRVVLIDDDPLVGRVFTRILSRNHTVRAFNDAEEALDTIEADGCDAIICDINMPRMNGPQFYAALKARRPDLVDRVVFLSGQVELGAGFEGAQPRRLEKPVERAALEAALLEIANR